jgi:hypothetical protein
MEETAPHINDDSRSTHSAHNKNKHIDKIKPLLKELAIPAAALLAITLVMFWPITTSFSTRIAGNGGDAYQSLWNLWWVAHAIQSGQSIWQTKLLFWPVGANLITQDMEPISALISMPFILISLGAAYNFIFIIGFVLSGLGMYLLAKYLTGSRYASFIAGIIFTFSAVHIAQAYGHINYTNLEWLPIFVLLLLKTLDTGKYKYAVLLGLSFVLLMFMADIELGIQAIMLSIAVLAGYLAVKQKRHLVLNRRTAINMLIFVACAFIAGSWAYIPILHFLVTGGSSSANSLNNVLHNELWSADLESFFLPLEGCRHDEDRLAKLMRHHPAHAVQGRRVEPRHDPRAAEHRLQLGPQPRGNDEDHVPGSHRLDQLRGRPSWAQRRGHQHAGVDDGPHPPRRARRRGPYTSASTSTSAAAGVTPGPAAHTAR